MDSLSFREKSILGTLLATVVVSAAYFTKALPLLIQRAELREFLWPAIAAAAATIIVHLAYHALLGRTDAEQPHDERDRFVDLTATRWAYLALSMGGIVMFGVVIGCDVFDLPLDAALIVHAIALNATVADVTKYVAQLAGYRALV